MCAAPNAFVNLLPAKKVVRYRPDEVIFSQGGPCGEVFYIEEGLVKLTTVSNRGRGAVLGILGHGDFLGEECLSSETHHQASAVALVPTSIVVTKRRTMLRLIERDRAIAAHLIEFLLHRNRRIEEDLIDRVFNSSEKSGWPARCCCSTSMASAPIALLSSNASVRIRSPIWWAPRDRA